MMKKITTTLIILAIVLLLQSNQVYAKSDNNGSGNSGNSENSKRGSSEKSAANSSKTADSNKSSAPTDGSEQKKGNSLNSNRSGIKKNEDLLDMKQEQIHRGRGGLREVAENEATEDARLSKRGKKLDHVKIIEATQSAQGQRRATQGVITSLSPTTLILAHQIHRDRLTSILYSEAVIVKSKSTEASGSALLAIGQRVIVVGDLNSGGQLVARKIIIIPGHGFGIFKKNPISSSSATPSSTLAPSPSASASAATI